MGTPDLSARVLRGLIDGGHEVVLCVTQPDKQKGRGKHIQTSPVKDVALSHGIEISQPLRIKEDKELLERLKALKPDISVVAAFGQILPKEVLDVPRFGSVNVHASLLPELRGASPIQHAILEGKEETGVTIMQMGPGLDDGDMISKRAVKIGNMNFEELHDALAEAGTELLLETLPEIENGTAVRVPQDGSLSTYAPLISRQDGHLDFSMGPDKIINRIRAFDPWPGAFAVYNEKGDAMKFWKAEALDLDTSEEDQGRIIAVDNKSFTVACGGKAIKVLEVQVPNKKRMPTEDYLRGNSLEKGLLFR